MAAPNIEVLWWEGCPSTDRALQELRLAMDAVGLTDTEIHTRRIETDDDARAAGFAGSPTILIDGCDVSPPGDEEPIGLSCRVYRRRDGRISPTPDSGDLRDALRRALARAEVKR